MNHEVNMIDIQERLPEVNQEVTIHYQLGEDPTVYCTTLHWWDAIQENYHVICWCPGDTNIY